MVCPSFILTLGTSSETKLIDLHYVWNKSNATPTGTHRLFSKLDHTGQFGTNTSLSSVVESLVTVRLDS